MPQLARLVKLLLVEVVFELCVFLSKQLVKFRLVFDVCEFEGFTWCENDGLFGEVAVRWVI